MKFALCTLCLVAVVAVVAADAGMTHFEPFELPRPLINATHFIPKAFYTLDSDGHKSDVHPINPHTAHYLRRLRRQTFSSSSSSSSVSSDGGPAYFTAETVNSHSPDVGFETRFGGAAQPTGHVVRTEGVISDGKLYYNTHEGHF